FLRLEKRAVPRPCCRSASRCRRGLVLPPDFFQSHVSRRRAFRQCSRAHPTDSALCLQYSCGTSGLESCCQQREFIASAIFANGKESASHGCSGSLCIRSSQNRDPCSQKCSAGPGSRETVSWRRPPRRSRGEPLRGFPAGGRHITSNRHENGSFGCRSL